MTNLQTAIQALLDADIYTDAPECQDDIAALKAAVADAIGAHNQPCRLVIGVRGGCAEIDDCENLPPQMQVFITDYDTNDARPDDPCIVTINGDLAALFEWMGADLNDLHDGTWGKTVARTWASEGEEK